MRSKDFKITKSDKVRVELFVETNHTNLWFTTRYRIVEPFVMPWNYVKLSFAMILTDDGGRTPMEFIHKTVKKSWDNLIFESKKLDDWDKTLKWVEDIKEIEMVEMIEVINGN